MRRWLLQAALAPLALLTSINFPASALEIKVEQLASASYTVVRVDPNHDRLQLFPGDDTNKSLKGFAALNKKLAGAGQTLQFAMNAGMFERDLSPVGLLVIDGQELAPLNLARGFGNFYLKPNGVFMLTDAGARVLESSEYRQWPGKVLLATQSGPLLVQHGAIHPSFNPQSTSRLIRNGVGVTSSGEVVFAISETPVNFFEFATLFRDVLRCPDALYLDGNVSSLFIPALGRNDARARLGPIIGVVQ